MTGKAKLLAALGLDPSATYAEAERSLRLQPAQLERWQRKLVMANPVTVREVQARLSTAQGYSRLVDSFSLPVDRLVAIHLANALIAHRVPPTEAPDLAQWEPTAALANGRHPFSLTPLVTAYCASDLTAPEAIVWLAFEQVVIDHSQVAQAVMDLGVELASHA